MSRRVVLMSALAMPLAGCRIRLESDAPPFLGEPSPDPAGPALLAERDRVAAVVAAADDIEIPLVAPLQVLHREQLARLDEALARLDPPVTPPPLPTGGATTAGPGSARPTLPRLADLEFQGLDEPGLAEVDAVVPRVAPLVIASHVQRAVALDVLRAAGVRGGDALPELPWVAADRVTALDLIGAVRAAAYGLEVVAARTEDGRRDPVLEAIARLRRAEALLGAGVPDLPPRPLGYPLPGPVDTPARAARLAVALLDRLTASALAAVPPSAAALSGVDLGAPGPATPTASVTPTATTTTSPGTGTSSTWDPRGSMGTIVRLATLSETSRIDLGGTPRLVPGLARGSRAARPSPSTPRSGSAEPTPPVPTAPTSVPATPRATGGPTSAPARATPSPAATPGSGTATPATSPTRT